ncbi:hypothetical protein [Streptomyces griseofuscus]|nr:hypothetical protein [Streptomyces griseofuscus]
MSHTPRALYTYKQVLFVEGVQEVPHRRRTGLTQLQHQAFAVLRSNGA